MTSSVLDMIMLLFGDSKEQFEEVRSLRKSALILGLDHHQNRFIRRPFGCQLLVVILNQAEGPDRES